MMLINCLHKCHLCHSWVTKRILCPMGRQSLRNKLGISCLIISNYIFVKFILKLQMVNEVIEIIDLIRVINVFILIFYNFFSCFFLSFYEIFKEQIFYFSYNYKRNNMEQIQQSGKVENQQQIINANLTLQQKLQQRIQVLEAENKRLKTKIAEMEPHKQKKLRTPNQLKIQELFKKFVIKKFALKVAYLGFSYDGMAYQKLNDENTVESFIFKALHSMSLISTPLPGEDYTRAGRTDKGVSAMGNVISLKLRSNTPVNPEQLAKNNPHKRIEYCSMLNALLPEDIKILACQQVSDDFNARYWCTKRSYKYFFAKNNLNIEAMKEGIKLYVGTHNFINYCKINLTNTVNFERTIFSAEIVKSQVNQIFQTDANQVYYFHFVGNSFLWHQIRFMSSILFMIGTGQEKPSIVTQLLDLNKFSTKPNYPMAPEYPLILEDCQYPDLTLQPDLKTAVAFYKSFNELVMKKSTEKTLIINCMMMAQRDIINGAKISREVFLEEYKRVNNKVANRSGKTLSMHKSSGRSLEQAKKSLKGKKLELYENKMKKQEQFDRKQKQLKTVKEDNQQKEQQQQVGKQQQQIIEGFDVNEDFD